MKTYTDVRDAVFEELFDIAAKDKKVIVLTVDMGARALLKFKERFPSQVYNLGIAEQNAMSVAAGLASTGRHVFIYGIANFVTLRCLEQIKIDIVSMKLSVTILASGTGYMYGEDGPTHHMVDTFAILRTLPGLTIWSPSSLSMTASMIHLAYEMNCPSCIWFDRGPFSAEAEKIEHNIFDGVAIQRSGKDVLIVSTGIMVNVALLVAEELKKNGVDAGVLDVYRLKPLNKEFFLKTCREVKKVVTLEEHIVSGGLGGMVCEFLAESNLTLPIKTFGIHDAFRFEVGNREQLQLLDGISLSRIMESIQDWLRA